MNQMKKKIAAAVAAVARARANVMQHASTNVPEDVKQDVLVVAPAQVVICKPSI